MTTPDSPLNNHFDWSKLPTLLDQLGSNYIPHISANLIIFGYDGKNLQVLLQHIDPIKEWAAPGIYIRRDQSVDEAAASLLVRTMGYEGAYMRQLHLFGDINRTEPAFTANLKKMGIELRTEHWIADRVISIAYLALVDLTRSQMPVDANTPPLQWWDIASLPPLMLDHDAMIEKALSEMRSKLDALPLGTTLLPNVFTMAELHGLYEAVQGISLDRRNFQKRMLLLGLVARNSEKRSFGPHPPAYLYSWVGSSNALNQVAASTKSPHESKPKKPAAK